MGSVMLTSVRISMLTPLCLEAPPCTPVLLTVCRRRSPLLLPPPSRSRSLLHLRGSTPSGSEAPSLHLSQHSNRCGSPSRNTMSVAHPLSTASASKCILSQVLLHSIVFNDENKYVQSKKK